MCSPSPQARALNVQVHVWLLSWALAAHSQPDHAQAAILILFGFLGFLGGLHSLLSLGTGLEGPLAARPTRLGRGWGGVFGLGGGSLLREHGALRIQRKYTRKYMHQIHANR